MARVTGVGGVFLRSADPKALGAWYAKHLGVEVGDYGATFSWKDEVPKGTGMTAWNPFPMDTTYFGEGNQAVMINYRVDDLDALLVDLAAAGVWIDPKRHERELWSLRLDQGLRREQGGALAAARDARDVSERPARDAVQGGEGHTQLGRARDEGWVSSCACCSTTGPSSWPKQPT